MDKVARLRKDTPPAGLTLNACSLCFRSQPVNGTSNQSKARLNTINKPQTWHLQTSPDGLRTHTGLTTMTLLEHSKRYKPTMNNTFRHHTGKQPRGTSTAPHDSE